jgi:pimeloyl-ACP methyl ester carboxylesterase
VTAMAPDGRGSAGEAHRGGSGSPVLLLHGVAMSWRVWEPVIAGLEEHHRVFAPTMPGHRGGPVWDTDADPFSIDRLVDRICDQLDAEGLDTVHVVGNSLGGWAALELVRRGRARSAVALSPAGAWRSGWDLRRLVASLRLVALTAQPSWAPAIAARPWLRHAVLWTSMEHGERVPPADVAPMLEDARGCTVLGPLLDTAAAQGPTRALPRLSCPTRIAWAERDHVIPWASYGAPMQRIVPDAEFVRLPGVGHVPMWDDPELVVDAVLGVTLPAQEALTPPGATPAAPARAPRGTAG